MQIRRVGSNANHGYRSVELSGIDCSFDAASMCFEIRSDFVEDFSGVARHDYVIRLHLRELVGLIHAAAISVERRESVDLAPLLRPSVPDLLRLALAGAADVTPSADSTSSRPSIQCGERLARTIAA